MIPKPKLDLDTSLENQTEQEYIMMHLAVLEEQLKNLNLRVGELMSDIRELKNLHVEKVITLEKEVSVLKEKVDRLEWMYRIVMGLAASGIIGAILSLILKH